MRSLNMPWYGWFALLILANDALHLHWSWWQLALVGIAWFVMDVREDVRKAEREEQEFWRQIEEQRRRRGDR